MNAESWAVIGTIAATVVFLILPGVVYAWYVLDIWIGDKPGYDHILEPDREAR